MQKVNIALLKNKLSKYVQQVRKGSRFLVTDRGKVVAKLVPVDANTDMALGEHMEQLQSQGKLGHHAIEPRFHHIKALPLAHDIASRLLREDRDARP